MRIAMTFALAATALAGAAVAQPPPGGGPGGPPMDPAVRFKMMDANADGAVTKDEWRGPAERFDAIDTNHDGKISPAELAAAPRGPRPPPPAQ